MIARFAPLAAALLAIVLVAPACVSSHAWPRPGPDIVVDQRAYEHGYEEGFRRGASDRRRARAYDYARHGDYRDADDGYRGGDRRAYRNLYRQGFVAGYNAGYRGAAGYGTRGVSPAADVGFRDGYEEGRRDGQRGRRYDPITSSRYRSGDHDYRSRYGPRESYKREYRAAFLQGYARGYRGL